MASQNSPQTMKPATAAKKLGVYLEATPEEFREGAVTRDELNALQADPPEWLRTERAIQAEVRREAVRVKEKHANEQRVEERKQAEAQAHAAPTRRPAPARRTLSDRGGRGR